MPQVSGRSRQPPPYTMLNIKLETKLNEPSDAFLKLPFAQYLPKDEEGILRLRIAIWERCVDDDEFRRDIDRMCSLDLVFFVTVFGWMHETRETQVKMGEFIPLLGQDQMDILSWWQEYGGKIDITNAKTRGIGLSYLACYYVMWLWLFNPHRISIGMMTRDEGALDKKDSPGSLMGKLDLIFEKLPPWMRYDEHGDSILSRAASNQSHRFFHKRLRNNIVGYVPTSDKLRSDRLYVLIADEAAALNLKDQDWLATAYGTVDSVIWISTHKGKACMFYRMTQNTKANLVRIETWWWNNARCRRGIYRIEAGRVVLMDDYKHCEGYFDNALIWDQETWVRGRPRSPWLDRPFFRPGIDAIRVLEEFYGLTALEDRRLLQETVFRVLKQTCRPPLAKGFLDEYGEWVDDAEGPISLWINPERRSGTFFVGVDPGLSELGGAYKVAAAFDAQTGEQVAVARYAGIDPTVFPKKVAQLADWLSGAKGRGRTQIAFESTGVGVVFHCGMERLRYPNLCSEPGKGKPGYANNDKGAAWLLELGRGIITGEVTIRDERASVELDAFEWDDEEDLQYSLRDGHGDTAIATSLMWWGGRERRRLFIKKANMPEHVNDPDSKEEPFRGRRRGVKLFSDRWR